MANVPSLAQVQQLLQDQVAVTDDLPFGPEVIVYRVGGKMFALLGWQDEPMTLNLKCDPGRAELLRQQYPAITPGYHMNKKHWNTLTLDGSLDWTLVTELVHHSYDLVVSGLRKAERDALRNLKGK